MTAPALRIECAFIGRGVAAVVELLTTEAPATARALWERLPIEADSYHTKWNGHEVFVVLPPFPNLAPEHPTGEPQPGDVVLFHFDATYRAAPRRERARGLGAYAELGLFYDAPSRAFGPQGPVVGTRLGRIVAGLGPLAEAARAMRRSGFEAMTIRRWP